MIIAIEALTRAHIAFVQRYASHPSIGATSNVPYPYPANGASEWYEHVSQRISSGLAKVFAITCDGEFCGVMSLNAIDPRNGTAELDYWVAVELQGKGIATRAATLAVAYAHNTIGLTTLFSGCLLRNVASRRVLEKCGFEEIAQGPLPHGKFKGQMFRRFKRRMEER